MKAINLLSMGNNMTRLETDMTRFYPITNNDDLHHHFIPKIMLRVARRAIIHPNNFPL